MEEKMMIKVERELLQALIKGAEEQVVNPNLLVKKDMLRQALNEFYCINGSAGLSELKKTIEELLEDIQREDVLKDESDGTTPCVIWEDENCCNDFYWYCLDNNIHNCFVPCYLCGYYDEQERNALRDANRIKMFLEGTWTYYPIRMD